jgi:hypothetical protein
MKTIGWGLVAGALSLSAQASVPGFYAGLGVGLQDLLADYRVFDVDEDGDVSRTRYKVAEDSIYLICLTPI